MSRIITIASQKGGVGKTTTALNLGYSLGRYIGPTLVLDFDPQSGMTLASNLKNFTTLGVFDMIEGKAERSQIVAKSRDGALSVVGIGDIPPDAMERFELAAWDETLSNAIRYLSEGYQYVIVDAPAGMGGAVHAALAASQSVILVADCQPLTVKSLPAFLRLIDHAAKTNSDLKLDGVLLSKFDERSATECEVREQVGNLLPGDVFFRTVIPYHEAFAAASMLAVPAVLQADAPELARVYLEMAMELRERDLVGTTGDEDDGPQRLF